MIKFLLVSSLLSTIAINKTNCQTLVHNSNDLYQVIQKHFQIIDSLQTANPDLMQTEELKFEKLLAINKQYIFNSAETINSEWLYVAKSPDKRFCLISWNTKMGGTMIDFATLAIYKKANGKLINKMLIDTSDGTGIENTLMHYDTVYEVSTNHKIFYLARGFGQGSTALPWQEIRAFEIKDDELVYPLVFPDHKSNIRIEFDTHEFDNLQKIPSIKIKSKGSDILVPKPTKKGGFEGKYLMLVLKGNRYQYNK